ncbi:ABC-F family ATP-binding cassette domain-containing protein [Paenibacillus larvae]|uniref:ABC transporter n=2 Tax=Paenibacillus larvae TaxID=1464 RepID=A0A1V0UNY9_9BACL|nr:ABC-F family ATP-binding cassette domain-containing protein [Paenibacillus larvae]ARF66806.1 ABC transporter [Paenibacillus larvae subsp. pulvifaciens]AVF26064.1 ABC transporter, ATP-binding protein [Paenibacillus larvae subsp. larvae]MCY9500738.1 ABC-F family ATP-binding cassette domain-containing protein [Paenibacillus larvae]MCY9509139.1 ABC-F family ATP-binding cassette domain-containing protein [Paenibacillus larvae]MCY9527348.1 ABC-F family ATP-binding cassette domain-containing prote
MSLLTAEHITKTYGEKVLFKDIFFVINEKERIGLIGVNGTGKSTLLKLLAGLETADAGKLNHAGDFRVDYLPQQPEFDETSTVLEQVFYGNSPIMQTLREYEQALSELEADPSDESNQARLFRVQQQMDVVGAWEAGTVAKTVLTKLGITDFTKPVAKLSGGQRKRVAMARVLIQPADLLILDEPTNHIDNETALWLEEYLGKWKGALLLVTHDRYFLDRVTNKIFELDHGQIYSYDGNYEVFLEKKAERLEREAASELKRQNLLRRELAWLRRGAKARTTKQKARVERAETLRDQKTQGPTDKLDMALAGSRLGRMIIELHDVSKAINGKTLFEGLNYAVVRGDRIGIIGRNGAGKSTLLNMLAGEIGPDNGSIEVGQTVKIAYYRQEIAEMDDTQRVIDYIKEAAEVIRTTDGSTVTAAQMLERFLFPGHLQWTPIGKLSGGEKRRLYLLRTLMGEPNVLLLDEPTNDLDIQTLAILEDYLEHFPGAVITVSHDRYFLDRTANHLFALEGNGEVNHFYGTYSDYMEHKKMQEALLIQGSKSPKEAPAGKPVSEKSKPKKLSYNEQKEWDSIEERITELEERADKLKSEIEAAGSDFAKVQQLFEEQQEVASELETALERWTYLSELVEEIERNKR